MGLKEVVFPVRHDRPYGVASGAFLLLVVVGEVEALALVGLGVVAHRLDLFLALQPAIAPAAFLVAVVAAIAIGFQQRAVRSRIRRYAEATSDVSAFAERVAARRTRG